MQMAVMIAVGIVGAFGLIAFGVAVVSLTVTAYSELTQDNDPGQEEEA